MFDELNADGNGYDFSGALNGIKNLFTLMAVNPGTERCPDALKFQSPEGRNVTSVRLLSKHRNTFQIGNILAHFNYIENSGSLDNPYKCLPSSEDNQLDVHKMAQGPLPTWLKLGKDQTHLESMQYILKNLLKEGSSVTLLRSPKKVLNSDIRSFCKDKGWKFTTLFDMTGSEDDTIIALVEDSCANLETLSRAKTNLIIVTRLV